jgi:hypothetical protein
MHVSKSKCVDTIANHFYFVGAESMRQVDKNVEGPLRNYDAQYGEQHPRRGIKLIEIKRLGGK